MRRAAQIRAALFVLLMLVSVGLRVLEIEVVHFVRFGSPHVASAATAETIWTAENIIYWLAYILAGLAFDRFGLKRTFAVVILVWAGLVSLGATVVDPATCRMLSPLLTVFLPAFTLSALFFTLYRAWPARRRAAAAAVLFLVYQYARQYVQSLPVFLRLSADVSASWQGPTLACVTVASILFALWTFALNEEDRDSGLDLRASPSKGVGGWRDMMGGRTVWVIVAIQTCSGIVWHESELLRWNFESLETSGYETDALLLAAVPAAAFFVAAWLSDKIYRAHRAWSPARRPFIVAGFVLAALVAIIGATVSQDGPALRLVDLCAFSAIRVSDLLVIDFAPRRAAGRFIGLVLAGEAFVRAYAVPVLERLANGRPHGTLVLIAIAALAGAGLTVGLRPTLPPRSS